VNTATWTAYNAGPTDVVTATASATVNVSAAPVGPEIAVEPPSLTAELLPGGQLTATVTISNSGDTDLTWTAELAATDCAEPGIILWASVLPAEGVTPPGGQSAVSVVFSAEGAPPGQPVSGVLCLSSNDPDEPVVAVPLSLTVSAFRVRMPIIIGSPSGGT
jgi:hypothetical protein